ncbi:energy-coupling factor transporter transmembrane component T [Paenibacillus sp.]|jgi:energy-coupling factor transport system permease protein|uniref:energy-coupling factor transporter transmembrane component T family protein n=1 Tax=Paenibacillus sp. TaxID=58172 RepID=UPI0028180500|nr:energy-coupling factor transporter transmembrane component T [Paenibacillus sp.]MDR0267015.1 energy-coupling factor transporter transmembrane protein EcfT [Paenibacillus sp.]
MINLLTPVRQTVLQRANPAIKLIVLIVLFLVTVQTRSIDFAINQAAMYTLLLFTLSGFPVRKMLLFVLPFGLLFVSSSMTMILFGKGDTLWWQWGLLRITEESFYRGLHLGFRSIAFAAEGLLFVSTTPSVRLFYALMQSFRLAPRFAYSFMASIRLLPMVWEEFLIRRQALQVRGAQIKDKGIKGLVEHIRLYAVPLLSQSIRRAHRVAVAMEAKQFNGKGPRTYYYQSTISWADGAAVLLLVVAPCAAYLVAIYLPWFGIADVRYHR